MVSETSYVVRSIPLIVDFHTHIYPPWLRPRREEYLGRDATFGELFASPNARMATAERLIRRMDEDGVDLSVVMGVGWTDIELARAANEYLIEAVRKYPDRLVGLAGVNPAWGQMAVEEVQRCAESGLRGIGELHPDTQRFDLSDLETMAPLMEVVREYGLIVTAHSSEPVGHEYAGKGKTHPEVLWRFIRNFPDASIVCAHWGGGLPFYGLMSEVKERLCGVYFDTAATTLLYDARIFETVSSLVGPEQVLMGSDYPLVRAHRVIREVESSGLPRSAKDMVLGENAARLLGL
ncbi:MAG: amidohydrolase family protein [Chloroflexi bacterium]|nr:amidohydrolase family protein [Chloroflexota bacterium]